jgi:hypothetical protein
MHHTCPIPVFRCRDRSARRRAAGANADRFDSSSEERYLSKSWTRRLGTPHAAVDAQSEATTGLRLSFTRSARP